MKQGKGWLVSFVPLLHSSLTDKGRLVVVRWNSPPLGLSMGSVILGLIFALIGVLDEATAPLYIGWFFVVVGALCYTAASFYTIRRYKPSEKLPVHEVRQVLEDSLNVGLEWARSEIARLEERCHSLEPGLSEHSY